MKDTKASELGALQVEWGFPSGEPIEDLGAVEAGAAEFLYINSSDASVNILFVFVCRIFLCFHLYLLPQLFLESWEFFPTHEPTEVAAPAFCDSIWLSSHGFCWAA